MYLEFLKNSFRQNFIYRGNSFMKVIVSFLYLFVTVSIWQALYRGRETVDGITLQEVLTFVLLSQLLRCLIRGSVSQYIAERIKSGSISIDFARPVNLKSVAFSNALGSSLFQVCVCGIPMLVMGALVWGFSLPDQAYQWIFFVLSVLLAVVLFYSFEYIMGLTVFWLKTDFHVSWIMGALMSLFSGSAIPLWFYPPFLQDIAYFFPFRFYLNEPLSVFLGKVTLTGCFWIVTIQIVWIIGLNLLGCILWRQAKRIVVVQGG